MGSLPKNTQLMLKFLKAPFLVLHFSYYTLMIFLMLFVILVLFERFNNTGTIDVKMGGSFLEEKSSFMRLGLTFSSKLDGGSCIISIAKTSYKKIGTLTCSMKFLSPEVALYLYKPTICPCMEYCCLVWDCAPICYLEFLDKNGYTGLLVLYLLLLLNP